MAKEEFIGTWKLVSFALQRSNGAVTYPFGKDAVGMLMYDAAGYMSVQLVRTDRPTFASGHRSKATPAELKAAFKGLITYFGTYEIDEQEKTITHQLESSSFPNWVGTCQTRSFQFFDDRLTLSTPLTLWGGDQVTAILIWERVA